MGGPTFTITTTQHEHAKWLEVEDKDMLKEKCSIYVLMRTVLCLKFIVHVEEVGGCVCVCAPSEGRIKSWFFKDAAPREATMIIMALYSQHYSRFSGEMWTAKCNLIWFYSATFLISSPISFPHINWVLVSGEHIERVSSFNTCNRQWRHRFSIINRYMKPYRRAMCRHIITMYTLNGCRKRGYKRKRVRARAWRMYRSEQDMRKSLCRHTDKF